MAPQSIAVDLLDERWDGIGGQSAMKIRNNRLEGEGVEHLESPNHSGPFEPGILDTIVVHFTDGGSAD